MATLADQTGHPSDTVSFQASATDPDSDTVTYTLIDGLSNASVDAGTGEFTWVPDWEDLRNHVVTIRATDPGGAFDQKSCIISVENEAPQLETLMDQTTNPEQPVTFTATAFDPDGDILNFEMVQGPRGATLDEVSGDFEWTPTENDIGNHPVTIKVSDLGNASDQKSCIITVEEGFGP